MDYTNIDLVDLWPIALGVLLPLVIAAVTRVAWSSRVKSLVMLAVVAVTTTVGLLIQGSLHPTNWREWVSALLVVFLTTTTTYRHVWRPTEVAPAIEAKVNPGPAPAATETDPDPDEVPWNGIGL